ncbi:MAG: hypothetical protein ACK4IK_09485 [Bacteroidia bacterium]
MKQFSIIFLLTVSFIMGSCNFLSKNEEIPRQAVARVYDKYLYRDELNDVIPSDVSQNDSAQIAENYIKNWIEQTLLLKKAEENLTDEQKDFNKQLEDYKRSLIIYAYQRELINQLLDTIVSDEEIEEYYENNKQNFELKDNIVKVRYIKVAKNAPDIKKLKKWYASDNPQDIKALESYCFQFAQNFYLDDKTWLLFDDLLKEIPIKTYNKEDFLKQNKLIELEDSLSYYFLNIKGYKIKNSISPLSFEKENIRNIIVNKRKLEIINKMKQDIYNDAANKSEFEIY